MSIIDAVDTYVLRVPLRRPVADSIYHRTHWHLPVVEVRTADGLLGTGISGVWAGEAPPAGDDRAVHGAADQGSVTRRC